VVDLLAKKQPVISSLQLERGSSLAFYLSLAVFLITAASAGGLALLNRAQQDALRTFEEEVGDKDSSLRTDLVNQIFLADQRLRNLRTLLSEHLISSNVFALVERDTLPQVRFLSFNFDATSRKLDMSGEATSYSLLARQIGVFEQDPNIERVEFGGLSLSSNNLAGFKIALILKKPFLLLKP
jgi:hypothetical protein